MGNKKIVIIAIILAVVFVTLLQLYLTGLKKEYSEGMEFVEILIANRDIPAHIPVSSRMITTRKVPQKYMHPRAMRARDKDSVIGQPPTVDVAKGQPILWTDFSGTKARIGLSGVIANDDERALTIPVTEVSGVGFLLKPDDHVDILGTFIHPKSGQTTTLTLLQNVTVLAVGTNLGTSDEMESKSKKSGRRSVKRRYSSVTLLVTPEEAELLIFSRSKGNITLMLRKEGAHQILENIPEMNFDKIFVPEVRRKIQKKRNERIEIIDSGKRR